MASNIHLFKYSDAYGLFGRDITDIDDSELSWRYFPSLDYGKAMQITEYVGAERDVEILDHIYGNPVVAIGDHAFSEREYVRYITIPETVTVIGKGAFSWCYELCSVALPDSLITIGDYAFSNCESLTEIIIPGSVKIIGHGAFLRCKNLQRITIQNGVTTIGDSAFSGCNLNYVYIPDSVTEIGWGAFGYSKISISVPDSVKIIREDDYKKRDNWGNYTGEVSVYIERRPKKIVKEEKPDIKPIIKEEKHDVNPIIETVVETPKTTVDSYVNQPQRKKAEEGTDDKVALAGGCLIWSGALYFIYWIIKSIWNFLFG